MFLKKHGKLISTLLFIIWGIVILFNPDFQDLSREVIAQVTLWMVVANGLLALVIFNLAKWVMSIKPELEWRLIKVNLNFFPLQFRYLGLVYLVIFGLNLPFFAFVEEFIFRLGTSSWLEAVGRSVLFGFVHLFAGVSIGVALILSLLGIWLTHWYFVGGLMLATANHTVYNAIIVLIIFCSEIHKLYQSIRAKKAL